MRLDGDSSAMASPPRETRYEADPLTPVGPLVGSHAPQGHIEAREGNALAEAHSQNFFLLPGRGRDDADDHDADAGMGQRAAPRRARQIDETAPDLGQRCAAELHAEGEVGDRAGDDPQPETDAERREPGSADIQRRRCRQRQ